MNKGARASNDTVTYRHSQQLRRTIQRSAIRRGLAARTTGSPAVPRPRASVATIRVTESTGPSREAEHTNEAETPQRRTLDWARRFELVSVVVAALLSPLIAGIGIWYSNSQIREQLEISGEELRLSREGQVTDRYAKAVDNLGDDSSEARLGGIYALQRIMKDSPRDHPTIANVLATYIRTHTTKPPKKAGEGVDADVAAALTVLAYRDPTRDGTFTLDLRHTHLPHIELSPLSNGTPADLAHATFANADLAGASLTGANLGGAFLGGADLTGADLTDANLTDAILAGANLTGVDLTFRDLTDMDLRGVNLTHANLYSANLTDVNLSRANLTGADLRSADLTGAENLTVQQLLSALIDRSTKLPAHLAKDPAIKAHIAEENE